MIYLPSPTHSANKSRPLGTVPLDLQSLCLAWETSACPLQHQVRVRPLWDGERRRWRWRIRQRSGGGSLALPGLCLGQEQSVHPRKRATLEASGGLASTALPAAVMLTGGGWLPDALHPPCTYGQPPSEPGREACAHSSHFTGKETEPPGLVTAPEPRPGKWGSLGLCPAWPCAVSPLAE